MKLKVISGIVLTMFLIGMLTLAFNVQPVKASGTIYIRADGSIDPPTANITSADNVTYTFTGNINDSIVVERDNTVVDGAGYVVQGTGSGTGINLTDRCNVTIKNMEIKAFDCGIWLNGSSGNTLSGNNITANNLCSIWLEYSSNYNSIHGNDLANSWYGIYLVESSNNSIYGNDLANNKFGISLSDSPNNSIVGNNIEANDWVGIGLYWSSNNIIRNCNFTNDGISIWGSLDECIQTIEDNVVNGKPLYYFVNQRGMVLDGMDAGQLILVNSTDFVIRNLNISHTDVGIQLLHSSNNIIHGSNIGNNRAGIKLWYSSNNSISRNNLGNNGYGILLQSSSNNSISENHVANNDYGISLSYSSSNSIHGNDLKANNRHGISLGTSSNNLIYHNDFMNNTSQAYVYGSFNNIWDDGYPSGGNYWSDYNGIDVDQDGIGDTPYIIDENNTDNYPLMGMFSDFPISSIAGYKLEKTYHVTTISNSTITSFGLYPIIVIGTEEWAGGAIVLDVTGPEGTKGFCRFTIPKDLLDCPEGLEYWTVRLNGTDVTSSCNIWENSTHTFIYVPYNHNTQKIMVEGTWIVPEFPTWTSMLLILIVLTFAITIYKGRLLKTPIH